MLLRNLRKLCCTLCKTFIVQARIKRTMRMQHRYINVSARTYQRIRPDAYISQMNASGRKNLSFVMHYNSFTSCGIVIINKTNSQVWGSSIIPCLIKGTKDIRRNKFCDVVSALYYALPRQKNTSCFYKLENNSPHFIKQQRNWC